MSEQSNGTPCRRHFQLYVHSHPTASGNGPLYCRSLFPSRQDLGFCSWKRKVGMSGAVWRKRTAERPMFSTVAGRSDSYDTRCRFAITRAKLFVLWHLKSLEGEETPAKMAIQRFTTQKLQNYRVHPAETKSIPFGPCEHSKQRKQNYRNHACRQASPTCLRGHRCCLRSPTNQGHSKESPLPGGQTGRRRSCCCCRGQAIASRYLGCSSSHC